METNQHRIEEVASDNFVKKELQPPMTPRRKKKKVSFAVWLEQQELKISAENIQQQDASPLTDNGSITKALEAVDQKGDKPTPDSESKEKNLVPSKTWSEEHVPADQEVSAENTEKQNKSLVSGEASTAGGQETVEVAEKEQPSMSKKQLPTTRRIKTKMIPFHIWLEKHAPVDLSSESTEEASLVAKQEPTSVLKETTEKEQPLQPGTETVEKLHTSLPEEDRDQKDSLKKEICTEEPEISVTQLVTEKNDISKPQRKLDQKGEKQSKSKRIKKTPLLWKSFPEPDACVDLSFFSENSDINNGPLPENQSLQAGLPSSGKKMFWKMLPKSEPRVDIQFFTENIEAQSVSMPTQDHDVAASLKKESFSKNIVIPSRQLVTTKESIFKPLETLEQKEQKEQRSPSPGKTTTQCTCVAKFKETELDYMEVQKYLFKQLDEMFNVNQKLNAKLKQQKDLIRKGLSERRQRKNSMVSVETQTDFQETPKQKTVQYSSASTQTEMDTLETSYQLKPVRQTTSTQTEMDTLETRCPVKPVYQSISTQTELFLLVRKQPSQTELNGHQDQDKLFKRSAGKNRGKSGKKAASVPETLSNEKVSGANSDQQNISVPEIVGDEIQTKETVISKPQQITEGETVSETQHNGDQEDQKKTSKKSKTSRRKIKRKAALKTSFEFEKFNNEIVSGENSEQVVSILGTVGDPTASIETKIQTKETVISKPQQITEEMVSTTQQNGDQEDQKKTSKTSRRKIKRKAALKASSELETPNNENASGKDSEHQVVSTLETVEDPTTSIINKIQTKEAVISKPQQITEETVSEPQHNGDQEDQKKPSKTSRCKIKRKAALKASSEFEKLNNEIVSGENSEQVVSILGTVGDPTASIETKIQTKETVISKPQQITEEMVSTTQQNGDQEDQKKTSKTSRRKIKRKAALKASSELETPNNENASGKDSEHQVVSTLETVEDPTASIINKIQTKEAVISKPQQITEGEAVSEPQHNGDQEDQKKPSKKSRCKKTKKMAVKAELETGNPIETEQNLVQNTKTPKTDLEIIPEIPQTAFEEIETESCKGSEDIPGKVPVVSTESEGGLMETPRTSPPQVNGTLKEEVIQTAQESEAQAAEDPAEHIIVSEEEEIPMKRWEAFEKGFISNISAQDQKQM